MSRKGRHDREEKLVLTKKPVYGIAIILTIVLISYYLTSTISPRPKYELKAVIVDQLSLTVKEDLTKTFNETATSILKQAGFKVDYFSGEKITVDFYRALSLQGYKVILLRVHSTAGERREGKLVPSFTVLFTSEPYDSTKYYDEQATLKLVQVYYTPYHQGDPSYFGITPYFVKQSMRGDFSGAIIILMGCEGLSNTEMAQAFIDKGAQVYISWNATVSAPHTDLATTHLLRHLLLENLSVKNSVDQTMNEVGIDPDYYSRLIFFPAQAGNYTIPRTPNSSSEEP